MYMPDARILRLEPNTTYIPRTRIRGFALGDANLKFAFRVMQISIAFRYQHVGIGNAKLFGHPTPVPNANGFASQWNIGFSFIIIHATLAVFVELDIYVSNRSYQ